MPATLFKKILWHRRFPVTSAKFLKPPFLQNTSRRLPLKCLNKKLSKTNKVTFLKKQSSNVLTYQAKMINYIIYFHIQWEVFLQIKFHPGMKFYLFHPLMKLTCKQEFSILGRVSSRAEISSWLHVRQVNN